MYIAVIISYTEVHLLLIFFFIYMEIFYCIFENLDELYWQYVYVNQKFVIAIIYGNLCLEISIKGDHSLFLEPL